MITAEIQQQLFEQYHTPPHVQRHCNEVMRVATILAETLNEHGYSLDVNLVHGAAAVHDMVRVEAHHDEEGAKILLELGYPQEADLVRQHMRYGPFQSVQDLREIDILCLADRTVCEDEYVGIDRRMDYLLAKPDFPKNRSKYIEIAREQTRLLIHQIEDVIGCTFEELFDKSGH